MKTIYAFSLSVILLSGSLNAATTVTHFRADLTSADVIAAGVQASTSSATAAADIWLHEPDVGEDKIRYEIVISGLDLDGAQTPLNPNDNVTAIHFHDVTQQGAASWQPGDTAGSKHTLNVYGVPRQDDANLILDAVAGTVAGIWDETDENSLTPAPSAKPSTYNAELFAGDLFVMIHSSQFPGGAIGGFLTQVPEPTSLTLLGICSLCLMRRTR